MSTRKFIWMSKSTPEFQAIGAEWPTLKFEPVVRGIKKTNQYNQAVITIFLHTSIYMLLAVRVVPIVGYGMQAIGNANNKTHNRILVFVFDMNLYEILMYYTSICDKFQNTFGHFRVNFLLYMFKFSYMLTIVDQGLNVNDCRSRTRW